MNLRWLQYFYDVAKAENIAKVAQKHSVPASSVSVSLKQLEKELGISLFDRSCNKIRLTEKGKLFAAELGSVLDKMDAVTKQLSQDQTLQFPIRVLIRARPKWITELIAQFKLNNPQINFIISNNYTITDIDNFDIIVDEDAKSYRQWDRFLLSTEIICVKAASNHPLVHKALTFADLKNEVFILPSPGNGMRNLYERTCLQYGITPNVAIECNDRQCLQYYVEANMGLTLGAYRALDDHTQNNIAPLKVTDFNAVQSVYVFHRESKHNSSAIKLFCDFLYQNRYV